MVPENTMASRIASALLFALTLAAQTDPYTDRAREVADRLIQTPVESIPYNWGEGVQMMGLAKFHERVRDPRYTDFLEAWADHHLKRDATELLGVNRGVLGERTGYCGHWAPSAAIYLLNDLRPKPAYQAIARRTVQFIANEMERSPDGGLGHWQGSHQLWVDTLFMACPLLTHYGTKQKQPEHVRDAAKQIMVYARHLQDQKTGLFYHMADWQTGDRTKEPWARGNGWVLMSIADVLEVLEPMHPDYEPLLHIAEKMLAGLKRTQDAQGLWHTLLDDPASYAETSATAMVVYGTLKLVRHQAIPARHAAMAHSAWKGINEGYVKEGRVLGVSAGTSPKDRAYYRNVRLGSETWGTGAYLLAASETARLR